MISVNPLVDTYFGLIQNLSEEVKLELISRISKSILVKREDKQEQLLACYGAFVSEQSADEMINSISKVRNFRDKNIDL